MSQVGDRFKDSEQIVSNRELPKDARLLWQVTQAECCPLMHRQGRNACSGKVDLTEIRLHKTCDHVKAGGLARTIGSKQADYLSRVYMKGDVRYNGPITELFSEMLDRKL